MQERFWEIKSLQEMSAAEWESLCDGCGLCCRLKMEAEDTGDIAITNVVCQYLEQDECHCSVYKERKQLVPECMVMTPENLEQCYFAPSSCAYRRLAEGNTLPDWHPLITGSKAAMQVAGIAVTGKVVSELGVHPEQLSEHIIEWHS